MGFSGVVPVFRILDRANEIKVNARALPVATDSATAVADKETKR
jgi:hypothetical protein